MTSKSVNVPTNVATKERDVNAKLQLYGIFTAFANGKVPSNSQIDIALNSLLQSKALTQPSKELSEEGRELVDDVRDVIERAKLLVLTKNDGNLLQDFIWQTQNLTGGNASTPNAPVDKQTAKQHGNEALDGLRTLGTLVISNGQFRKLLSDAVVLLRDIAGDGAQNAANKLNPSEDALKQIDEPAADNEWHENPDISVSKLKNQARETINKNKPTDRDGARDGAQDILNSAKSAGNSEGTYQDGAASGAKAGLENAKSKLSANLDDDTKDQLEETKEKARTKKNKAVHRTKNYLGDKMPKERREQTIWRLKKMVVEIQGHKDYQQAIETLLSLAEEYTGHTKHIAKQSTGAVKGAHDDDSLQLAETDLKTLIERFANSTSSDDLIDAFNQIYDDADRDPELRRWFKRVDSYIRKALLEQGYILEDSSTDEWNQIYDQGQFLLRDRYRNHTDRIVDEFKFLFDQFDKDPQNSEFAESLTTLFTDLGNDEDGKPTFKKHLLKDVTQVIIPLAFENIRYVPIPRIEYSDPQIDAIVENLVLEGDNLAPNVFELGSDNYWRWGRKSIPNKNKNKVMVSVSGIQMDLKDVSYYVKKKQGFPSLTDIGVMDIFLGGTGFGFKAALETADSKDGNHFFKVTNITVDLKNINIKLKQSKHKLLFNIFKPLLFKVITPVLTKVLQKIIKEKINQADAFAYRVHKEVKAAEADIKRNPEEAQNIYQRYYQAFQKQMLQGKEKADKAAAAAADKKVNVAITQQDSIFKNISLPGGISSKATEYKELAQSGEKWTSPVFKIGSAAETTNLPKVKEVVRKPHNTAPSTLRSGESNTNSGAGGYANGNAGGYKSNGNAGFSNQVSQAFDGSTGKVGGQTDLNSYQSNSTTLGTSNPVLQGTV